MEDKSTKILLFGSNYAAIEDFFRRLESDFEVMSCSSNFTDIRNHMKYFGPQMVIFCVTHEDAGDLPKLIEIRNRGVGIEVPFVILGNQDQIKVLTDAEGSPTNSIFDFALIKPITVATIKTKINNFIEQYEEELAERRKKEEENKAKEAGTDANLIEMLKSANASMLKDIDASLLKEGGKKRILVVDDDIHMIKTIKKMLENDYNVATAVNGKIALRYMENRKVDLVLLDYMMPEMDGREVLEVMRADAATEDIPVVFLTGASDREQIANVLSLKPQGYMLKPVDGIKLMEKVQEILGDALA